MNEVVPWLFYVSPTGREVVLTELKKMKLSPAELDRLDAVMLRVSQAEFVRGDIDFLGRDIWEVRARLINRIARILYFPQLRPVANVAVLAGIKKTQKTPRVWIDTAVARKRLWESIDG